LTVNVKARSPVVALDGDKLVVVGGGLVTPKSTELEAATPGFTTVIGKVPTVANSVVVTSAVSEVLLPNVVVSDVEPNLTTAPLTKSVPVTVSVNAEPPCIADVGEMFVNVAIGLTVKLTAFESAAAGAGLATVMENVPAVTN